MKNSYLEFKGGILSEIDINRLLLNFIVVALHAKIQPQFDNKSFLIDIRDHTEKNFSKYNSIFLSFKLSCNSHLGWICLVS